MSEENIPNIDDTDSIIIFNTSKNKVFENNGIRYKICSKCLKTKKMNNKLFIVDRKNKSGFKNKCRECTNEYYRNWDRKNRNSKGKTNPAISKNKIKLDLTEIANQYPDIYKELKIHAKERFRTKEQHAFWLINLALNNFPIHPDSELGKV